METQSSMPIAAGGVDALIGAERAELRAVCHDMRQPLAVILLLASHLLESADVPAASKAAVATAADQAEVLVEMVRSLLHDDPRDEAVCLRKVAAEVVESYRHTWTGTFTRSSWCTDDAVVVGSSALLRRALANLVDNATRAAGPRGSVHVSVRGTGRVVEIVIEDDGPGLGHVTPGTGLGLQIVHDAARRHDGVFTLASSPMGGVSARLRVAARSD